MKLNLLPTYVSKEGQSKLAWVFTIAVILVSAAAGIFAVVYSKNQVENAARRVAEAQPAYDQAMRTSKMADEIMAASVVVDRNRKLADAMLKHNSVYPNLYNEVLSYVPAFYRVNTISAVPNGPGVCTVTMQGVLQTAQQYADVMLAMLRVPGAMNVTRTGFVDTRKTIPPLNEQDQVGTPVKPGEPNLPSDPRQRLQELVTRASQQPPDGFLNANGFGVAGASQKGPMPDWSLVTITVTLTREIQTPDPRATLSQQGGANQAPSGGSPSPSGPSKGGPGPVRGAGG